MAHAIKPQFTSDFQEFESQSSGTRKMPKTARVLESVRLALTTLGLLASLISLGLSTDTLVVYNQTHLGHDYYLPLWPADFDIRPTTALVICSTIIFLGSIASLVVEKVPAIRSKTLIHKSVSYLAPATCLIASLIAISFFYGVNSSSTVSSLKSWTCQWSAVKMSVAPHWGTLCRESKASLYLMVMIIPLEVLVLAAAAVGALGERRQVEAVDRKGSPTMS